MLEEMHLDELFSYDKNGKLLSKMRIKPLTPSRLQWYFTDELVAVIDEAYNDGMKVVEVRKICD
jgi:hypothetical protein